MTIDQTTHDYLEANAGEWLREASGCEGEIEYAVVDCGRNNRVYRAKLGDNVFCLKWFFTPSTLDWDRLDTEIRFSQWCALCDAAAPRLISFSHENRLAAYQWIDGKSPTVNELGLDAVEQLLQFLAAVNPVDRGDVNIGNAAEACYSLRDHFECVANRLERFRFMTADDRVSKLVKEFVLGIRSDVKDLRAETEQQAKRLALNWETSLQNPERILSPSDFGFHNALRDRRGKYVFCDFEYAGWDDPAKTICDAVCQVQVPIPMDQRNQLVDGICRLTPDPERTLQRASLLLPLYRMKWCGILLNTAHVADQARREFARDESNLSEQLGKATKLAASVREPLKMQGFND